MFMSKWLELQRNYQEKYQFLGLREETWMRLFKQIDDHVAKDNLPYKDIRKLLDQFLNQYITKQIN